jgi:quinol-cytochrome oxidoreductase complex cytochrome b subunit
MMMGYAINMTRSKKLGRMKKYGVILFPVVVALFILFVPDAFLCGGNPGMINSILGISPFDNTYENCKKFGFSIS